MNSQAIPGGPRRRPFEVEQVQAYCLIRQHLENSNKGSDVVKVADDLCGLHATSSVTPYLSLFARMRRFNSAMLDSELGEGGRLVRVRGVRGTLFIVPRSRVPLIRNALGTPEEPTRTWYSLRKMKRHEFFELKSSILDALKGRSLSIQEIKGAVPRSKVRTISFRASKSVVRSATNVTWVVNWLVATGTVLSQKVGGLRDALQRKRPASDIESLQNRYVLSEDALGRISHVPQNEARENLVCWYLQNYSPVTLGDLSWWTGFPIRKLLSRFPDLVSIRVKGLLPSMVILKDQLETLKSTIPGHLQINLLPYEDPFLKGYKLRDRFGSHVVIGRAYRGGSAAPTALVNGRIVGIWRFSTDGRGASFQVQTLEPIEGDVLEIINDHMRSLANFLFRDGDYRIHIR